MPRTFSSTTIKKYRINTQIKAREVRVTDAEEQVLGVFPIKEALAMANPEEGLDLIEVVPHAKPPVTRLMSFDKFRYIKDKEEKERRKKNKKSDIKQVRISARAEEHDWLIKLKQLEKFLASEQGPVEIQMKLRGRERSPAMKAWVMERINAFLDKVETDYKVVLPPKKGGRGMIMHIAKK